MMKIAVPFLLALSSYLHVVTGFTTAPPVPLKKQQLVLVSSRRLLSMSSSFTESTSSSSSSSSSSTNKKRMTAAELEETFYKAVEMASSTSTVVDLDECDRLATELEQFDNDSLGCEFEKSDSNPLMCEKEVQDRLDVAGILRLKIELSLRLDYLKNANLFADDVRKEHEAQERKRFKDALIANREKAQTQEGSDLGLW